MAREVPAGTEAVELPPPRSDARGSDEGPFDWSLFAVLAVVLAGIAISNLWLRLRAEGRSFGDLVGGGRAAEDGDRSTRD